MSDAANQPFTSRDGKYTICYNGEVYNYKEIRQKLKEKGQLFDTGSDTEVMLHSYRHDPDFIHDCNGMYAFCIYDKPNEALHFYRDRMGIKPLYYYHDDDHFCFGSELKVFHEIPNLKLQIDKKSVGQYLKYGYVPEPNSIFQKVKKLKPGHHLRFDIKTHNCHISPYWSTDYFYKNEVYNPQPANLDLIESLLYSACEYRMIADVPVGVFLSGGYDSSLIAALASKSSRNPVSSFHVAFDDAEYDESEHAQEIARHLSLDHHVQVCTTRQAQDLIEAMPYYFDEPFGDSSAIPTMLVSSMASKHMKVCLSADGADELFGGYIRYRMIQLLGRHGAHVPGGIKKILSKALHAFSPDSFPFLKNVNNIQMKYHKTKSILHQDTLLGMNDAVVCYFSDDEVWRLITEKRVLEAEASRILKSSDYGKLSAFRLSMLYEQNSYLLGDILTKVDRASMRFSLEAREPYLDHRLVEYLSQVSDNELIRKGQLKSLLKKIAHRYVPKKTSRSTQTGVWCSFGKMAATGFATNDSTLLIRKDVTQIRSIRCRNIS